MTRPGHRPPHDFALLLLTRTLRAFGFGFTAVLVGIQLERRKLPPNLIGLTLTLGLAAASLLGLPLAAVASRAGRRVALALAGLGMTLTGLDLALAEPVWLLALSGATGMLGAGALDLGPFASIEQALVAESVAPGQRNRALGLFALWSARGRRRRAGRGPRHRSRAWASPLPVSMP